MKNILVTSILLCFVFNTFAQIKVLPVTKEKLSKRGLSEEAIQQLRGSTTIFFYRKDDNVEELKKAIEDIWTISKIGFIPYSEIENIEFINNSFLVIEGFRRSAYLNDNTFIYLRFYMNLEDKKGREYEETFARVELFPSYDSLSGIWDQEKEEVIDYIYSEAEIRNWNPGFLRNYLKNVNDLLEGGGERGLYDGQDDLPAVLRLENETLYIPDYVLKKMHKFTGNESDIMDPNELLSDYPYDYKFLSAKEISDKILAGDDFYYLVYTKSSLEKYYTVYHSTDGEIIFSLYKPMSNNMKDSDFEDIAKSMDKIKRKME